MCENYTSGVGLPSGGSHKSCVSASKKASVSSGAIANTSPISENKKNYYTFPISEDKQLIINFQ